MAVLCPLFFFGLSKSVNLRRKNTEDENEKRSFLTVQFSGGRATVHTVSDAFNLPFFDFENGALQDWFEPDVSRSAVASLSH